LAVELGGSAFSTGDVLLDRLISVNIRKRRRWGGITSELEDESVFSTEDVLLDRLDPFAIIKRLRWRGLTGEPEDKDEAWLISELGSAPADLLDDSDNDAPSIAASSSFIEEE